jgi:hypothetical protein
VNIRFCLSLWKAAAEAHEKLETVLHVWLDGFKDAERDLRALKMIHGVGSVSCFKSGNSSKKFMNWCTETVECIGTPRIFLG